MDRPGARVGRWAGALPAPVARVIGAMIVLAVAAGTLLMTQGLRVDRAAAAEATDGQAEDPVLANELGLSDPIIGTDIGGLGGQQYRNNNQRNFWWNAGRQRWDGILPTASPPGSTRSEWWLWHDLGGTPTPVAAVEQKTSTTPDAYWDEDVRTLYVFFSRGNSGTSRFRRYVYDPTTDRYVEHSRSGGVAAPDMLRGGSRVTITKSPNGHLWAGVNYDNTLLVSRSTDGGDSWPDPVAIKTTAISGEGHWTVFTVGGSSHVGFAASEDGKAPDGQAKVHFLHLDQDEPDWTDPARWTDETGDLPPWEGDERADDELSAVVFENRVFVVIETEPLGDSRTHARPQVLVFERQATGGWTKHVVQRYTPKGVNDAKRPVVTVDASTRQLIVTGGTTKRSHADMWYAPIDALAGRDEQWSRLRIFEVDDPATENIYNTRLPLPRFPVTAESDLLTMIDDQGDAKRMWRQVVRSGAPNPDTTPPTVALTAPSEDATVSGSVTVDADASDDRGVDSVEFLVDESSIGRQTDGSDGWWVSWDTRTVSNGSHTLTAVARDRAGNSTTSDPVQVTVDNTESGTSGTVEAPVAASWDDAEERSNGRMWMAQSNLDFMTDVTSSGEDHQRAVGLRFTGIAIPRGATITSASVQFQADKATSSETTLTISGHASDDATGFVTERHDISSRPRTAATLDWSPPPWEKTGHRNAEQRTPDLSSIVQQVVDRPGWTSGNALALIVEGSGERVAESFDGGVDAPTLSIEYTAP